MHATALITLLSLLFYFYLSLDVGRARVRCKVKAPATTGDPVFERLYRVQMNTLEWLPLYLPCLWMFGWYVSDLWAAAVGAVWIVGRFLYKTGYEEAREAQPRLWRPGLGDRRPLLRRGDRARLSHGRGRRAGN